MSNPRYFTVTGSRHHQHYNHDFSGNRYFRTPQQKPDRSYSAMRKAPTTNQGDFYSPSTTLTASPIVTYTPSRLRGPEPEYQSPQALSYSLVFPGAYYSQKPGERDEQNPHKRDFHQRAKELSQRLNDFHQRTIHEYNLMEDYRDKPTRPRTSYIGSESTNNRHALQNNSSKVENKTKSRPKDFLARQPKPEPAETRARASSSIISRGHSLPPSRFLGNSIGNDMDCIIPPSNGIRGVFLGNIEAARNIKQLKRFGISAVLTAAYGTGVSYSPKEAQIHRVIPADDIETFDLSVYFQEAIEFLEDTREVTNVLVHCFAGMSRSATLLIAYLIYKNNWSLGKALTFCQNKRPIVQPNPGFMRQLKRFEKEHFARQHHGAHLPNANNRRLVPHFS